MQVLTLMKTDILETDKNQVEITENRSVMMTPQDFEEDPHLQSQGLFHRDVDQHM